MQICMTITLQKIEVSKKQIKVRIVVVFKGWKRKQLKDEEE